MIADAYENASKKEPSNEEFLSHLFMAYVRCGNYKKQQQTAMALYKAAPKNPYYFWAIMSIVMQVSAFVVAHPCYVMITTNIVMDNKKRKLKSSKI